MNRQILPDCYSVPVKLQTKKPCTNGRYKNFTQTHFTAGDEEQFDQTLIQSNIRSISDFINPELNNMIWEKYKISPLEIKNTFRYIFYKFKKGVFIQIRNGQLLNFLPFSNNFFVNEWHDRIEIPHSIKNDPNVLHPRFWYANNGLLRYESPINETDTGMCQIKNMLETLCKQYKTDIPDIDFFINKRDFPILKKDGTEPYENIYDSTEFPLVSHSYPTYCPILSSCTADGFADIPIPTMDDWTRISFKENTHFVSTKRVISTCDKFTTPWSKKINVAIFRGTTTGLGYNSDTNIRINLFCKFKDHPHCDIGITSCNTRIRKFFGIKELVFPEQNLPISKPLTLEEQSRYKFIIHAPGHVQAFRLSVELAMGSVILLISSKYRLWYENKLIPWEHYVPVKEDLSDLDEQITWCLENDSACAKIADNARKFYDTVLCKESCLSYLKELLCSLSTKCVDQAIGYPKINTRNLEYKYLNLPLQTKQGTYKPFCRELTNLELLTNSIRYTSDRKQLFQNTNTTVTLYDKLYVCKTSRNPSKIDHENFIGIYGVNKVLRHIPNFCYTIPYSNPKTKGVYLEYLTGYTMFDYIKSSEFKLNEWYFCMIQIILSLSVAQRICFFTHYDLCSWNIILQRYPSANIVDYMINSDCIYRVWTNVIPIIFDYDKSYIIHELQSFSCNYKNFSSYQDILCLFVNCVHNIFKFQKLTRTEEDNLLYLSKNIIVDPIYCPQDTINNIKDLKIFLNDAHKYSHLIFSNKGNLDNRNTMSVLELFKMLYKPMYNNPDKALQQVDKVSEYIHRNIGDIPKRNIPHVHPILNLYLQQIRTCTSTEIIQRPEYEIKNINIPQISEAQFETIHDVPKNYLEFINILEELIVNSGPYKLSVKEKSKIKNFLINTGDVRKTIYKYSKYLVNFKLQRNIL